MSKTVLITGASRGIGREIAINLAKENYNVLINYNNSEKQAIELKAELLKYNKNIEIFKADVSQKIEVENMIKFCLDKFKNIDILINNAGIAQIKPFLDITQEDWNNMINININSIFNVTQEVLRNMIQNKCGCIINISSVLGMVGSSCEVPYSTAKAGIIGFTKALAKELGPSNIRVNSVAPGMIDTDMNLDLTEEVLEEIKNETPLGKIGQPIDIFRCVKWLIEDEFTTGQVISPNGGWIIT